MAGEPKDTEGKKKSDWQKFTERADDWINKNLDKKTRFRLFGTPQGKKKKGKK